MTSNFKPTEREELACRSAILREHAPKPDIASEWERISRTLDIDIETGRKARLRTIGRRCLYGIAAVAAVALLFFVFTNQPRSSKPVRVFSANHAAKEVILTTPDGAQKIMKNDATTFRQARVEPSPRMLTLTTPRGKDYQVTLPDGTKVWMNADSKLTFPETFSQTTREVTLVGEAYFEVAKESERQFIVNTDFFTTIVHGTTFNIRAYSPDNASIVLIEGSVTVGKDKQFEQLKPGEMACWKNHGGFTVTEVDTYSYLQWRNGFFYFDNQSLLEIMRELGRWYNVNIMFDDPRKMNLRLHFVANRSSNIEEAIKNMNELGVAHIEQEQDAVIIK